MNLSDIRRQLTDARPAIIGGLVATVLLLGMVVIIHFWRGALFGVLMNDPTSRFDAPAYLGAISHIGVMMWAATGAICLFTAWTIWRAAADPEDVRFFAWSGLGTLYLGLDDVMLLHDHIIPRLTGLPEEAAIAAYVIAFVFYLVRFHAIFLKTEYVLLGIALFFLGLSIAQDVLLSFSDYLQTFLEDGAKLLGIIFWLIFYVRTGAGAVRSQHQGALGTTLRH